MNSPIVESIRRVVLEVLKTDGMTFIGRELDKKIEAALDGQVALAVTAELHRQFAGKEVSADAAAFGDTSAERIKKRKKRPRCEDCGAAKRKNEIGGWDCRKCKPDAE